MRVGDNSFQKLGTCLHDECDEKGHVTIQDGPGSELYPAKGIEWQHSLTPTGMREQRRRVTNSSGGGNLTLQRKWPTPGSMREQRRKDGFLGGGRELQHAPNLAYSCWHVRTTRTSHELLLGSGEGGDMPRNAPKLAYPCWFARAMLDVCASMKGRELIGFAYFLPHCVTATPVNYP